MIEVASAAFCVLMAVLFLAAGFFWSRGVMKGSKGDLIAGPLVLLALCASLVAFVPSSEVFGGIGLLVAAFGVGTLVLFAFAESNCPLSKRDILAIGVGMVIAGVGMGIAGLYVALVV